MESERVKDRSKLEPVPTGGEGPSPGESRGESSRPHQRVSSSKRIPISRQEGEAGPSRLPSASSSASPHISHRSKGKQRDTRPRSTHPHPTTESLKSRALSPPPISHPMPLTELRQLKKEAYAKYHPPRPSTVLGSRTVSAGSAYSGKTALGSGYWRDRGKGQPNMGARMGVLLEKIKRDRAG